MLRIFLLLTIAAAICPPALSAAAPPSRPNIVMIVSDDHAWSDYSFMGSRHVHTPNIDRLAAEGLAFPRGYVPSSLCCPSLASVVTGLYPHQHGITGNDPPNKAALPMAQFHQTPEFETGREEMNRLLEAVPTLPRQLGDLGYVSLQTGKWWQGNYKRGGFTAGMTHGSRHGDEGLSIGRKTMEPIYEFIADAREKDQPFFVWYAPMMPHLPHTPPERLLKKYRAIAPSKQVAKYWAMVEWFDETVGSLLSHLDEQGLSDDTIVVYVADNGWITNPETGAAAAKSKQSPYDGGLRTPIILRWPGHIAPEQSDDLAISLDLAPTLLAAAGAKPTAAMPGINLLDKKPRDARTSLQGECFTHDILDLKNPAVSLRYRWIISGHWKLIVPAPQNEPDAKIELYNLQLDPSEEQNLAADHPDVVKQLSTKLDAWWNGEQPATAVE
ncbi:sulfatase [Lacipirellula parvula]|uniref:Arylsulfatase n=1 Tax=Lacipirellula parvula TaxID=2650471 RepID=A0A5K7X879_9BACT|nr:sulfatase-like hydrolase/transferase [Lacipirellula parvula]BBO32758.1 arylsulfatase [Lacipirellula parvula]